MTIRSSELAPAMTAICADHLALAADECLLIVSDTSRRELADAMASAAGSAGFGCISVCVGDVTRAGQAPPEFTADLLTRCPAALLVTGKSLSHTDSRRTACYDRGVRIASMPGITAPMLARLFRPGAAVRVAESTERLARRAEGASFVRVSGPAGTDIELSVSGRRLYTDTGLYHEPGDFGNLPAGEIAWAPVAGSARGRIVCDVAFAGLGAVERLELTVEDGRIARAGGERAGDLLELLAGGPERTVGEFGVGTNPFAEPGPVTLEAEKAVGTVHFGFGDNRSFGGENRAAGHWDCVVRYDVLELDGNSIEVAP